MSTKRSVSDIFAVSLSLSKKKNQAALRHSAEFFTASATRIAERAIAFYIRKLRFVDLDNHNGEFSYNHGGHKTEFEEYNSHYRASGKAPCGR